jgi:signal transduction histidine kinase
MAKVSSEPESAVDGVAHGSSVGTRTFRDAFFTQPNSFIYWEMLLLALFIGWLDYITDWELSLFIFYAFPIFLVTWVGGRNVGILFALGAALIWHLANSGTQPYRTTQGYALATLNRLGYFIFVALGAEAMRKHREEVQARIEALTRARELEQEIVRVSEREQIRIGQDLHDGLCQNLAAIDCAAACLKADLDAQASPTASMASTIQDMVKSAVTEARDIARGIFPVQMDAGGLAAALSEVVARTNQLRLTSASFAINGDIQIADPEVAMHLYRIGQEALSNAARHAQAEHVSIVLSQEGSRLSMTIADDGRGFTPEASGGDGMGLRTMRYRAQLIGAEFEVASESSGGTIVRCTVDFSDEL